MRKLFMLLLLLMPPFLLDTPSSAQPPAKAWFIAGAACPAEQSLRRHTNPGDVALEPGRAYELLRGNRAQPSHYLVVVPGAAPPRRWVAAGCGDRVVPAAPPAGERAADTSIASAESPDAVLAISWHPAFCETPAGRARPECAGQAGDRDEASRFSLHGLWPQPRGRQYCGVAAELVATDRAGRWLDLPPVALDPATADGLRRAMPGAQSGLDRHEWIRHGVCHARPDAYFAEALALLHAVNGSPVGELFAAGIGERLSAAAIRAAFDRAFGPGAGQRVRIACRRDGERLLIVELTLGLSGPIGADPDLAALLAAAPATDPGCPGGLVDPAGDQ